jgi:hypothetical protein
MALVASAYHARRPRRRAGNVTRRDTLVEDPPRKRDDGPTCAERAHAPFLAALSGYDRARTSIYDWSWMEER